MARGADRLLRRRRPLGPADSARSTVFGEADYLTMESTYGARRHEDPASVEDLLAEAVLSTRRAGATCSFPASPWSGPGVLFYSASCSEPADTQRAGVRGQPMAVT